MKLCTCNQCGEIFEDMNPQVGAKEYEPIVGIEQLIKLYPEPTAEKGADNYGGYWGCPRCCTDGYLSDTVDAAELDIAMEGMKWTCTDSDTGQYGRRLSTYKYEFKEDNREQEIIDLEKYSWKEICDGCEGYYPNMDELFKTYGEQSTWIIAECLFEMDIIKS